jgi:hypothetical protein
LLIIFRKQAIGYLRLPQKRRAAKKSFGNE